MSEITDVEKIYSEEYHASSGERGEKQYPAKQDMGRALDELLGPDSVIDVGCGRGWWMEYWVRERPDVPVIGLDGCAELIKRTGQCAESVRRHIYSCDLRQPGWWSSWLYASPSAMIPCPWSFVLCVEVGEHLDKRDAGRLVSGLCRLCDEEGVVFFSSARPGQKGVHHVNCQPKSWWIHFFEEHGFDLRMDLWRAWHDKLEHRGKKYGRNIRRNAMFFSRA